MIKYDVLTVFRLTLWKLWILAIFICLKIIFYFFISRIILISEYNCIFIDLVCLVRIRGRLLTGLTLFAWNHSLIHCGALIDLGWLDSAFERLLLSALRLKHRWRLQCELRSKLFGRIWTHNVTGAFYTIHFYNLWWCLLKLIVRVLLFFFSFYRFFVHL